MSTQYTINLNIPPETVQTLVGGKYSLCGFKAVQSSDSNSVPLVWFTTQNYLESNRLVWTEQYEAYLAEVTPLTQGTQIFAGSSSPIDFHQQVEATDAGLGTSSEWSEPVISIMSRATKPFICGLMLQPPEVTGDNSPTPFCAFNLLPSTVVEIDPVERVVLMFTTDETSPGMVYEQSTNWVVLIDLTVSNTMTVTYDLSVPGGWGTAPGVTPVQPPVQPPVQSPVQPTP